MTTPPIDVHVRRLGPGDRALARAAFALLAEVFETPATPLGDAYLDRLLARPDFWAGVALAGDAVVGCLTAHVLPMTHGETAELCVYDVALRADHQRRGVGRRLVDAARRWGAEAGAPVAFVLADDEDAHAIDFYRALGGEPSPVTAFTFDAPAE